MNVLEYAEGVERVVDPMLVARTEEELKEYVAFFWPMREDSVVARAIEIGEREIKARVKLVRKYRGEVLEEILKNLK